MPILVEPDTTTAGVLLPALPTGSQLVARPDEIGSALAGRPEYVVVLGPSLPDAVAGAIAEDVRAAYPAATVVLVRHTLAPEVFARAMQAGIGAVIAADDPGSLATAVGRAKSTWETILGSSAGSGAGDGHEGRVITVFSPKGGVGKTTMSVNLGLALAQTGAQVCILDLDLAFGDVAITLQMVPDHTIQEAADAEEHLDFAMLQTLLTRYDATTMILAAPTQPEGRDSISPELVRRTVALLRDNFDFVVIDTPPGFDDQVLSAFDETDDCVIVATLDVPTIKNTKVALETLDLLHLVGENRHLVLNRADDEVGLAKENVEGILNMRVTVSLPAATAVANATNHGQPIVQSKPDHPVSQGIVQLARRLAGDELEKVGAGAGGGDAARRGLFGRKKK